MNIVRGTRRHGFVMLPNEALEDTRLSFRARGVLAYLLSRPDGWQTDSEKLAAGAAEGRDAIRTALNELAAAGYLNRAKRQDSGGHWITECTVQDVPVSWKPDAWKTDAWKTVSGVTSGNSASLQVAPTTGKPTVGGPVVVVPNTDNKKGDLGHCPSHDSRRPACQDCLRTPLGLDRIRPATEATARQAAGRARVSLRSA